MQMAEKRATKKQIEAELARVKEEYLIYRTRIENAIEAIKNATRDQSVIQNHCMNPYAHGRANGLRHCVAILKDEEVRYLQKPLRWLDADYRKLPMDKH